VKIKKVCQSNCPTRPKEIVKGSEKVRVTKDPVDLEKFQRQPPKKDRKKCRQLGHPRLRKLKDMTPPTRLRQIQSSPSSILHKEINIQVLESTGHSREFNSPEAVEHCLSTLIPTLGLPISEEHLRLQINQKTNYSQEKHNIKSVFILELDSPITTSGRCINSDTNHYPLRVFRELIDHPTIYLQVAPGPASTVSAQRRLGVIRGFSSMPGIIESTVAALQHSLNVRAPRAQIIPMVIPLKTYFHPRNKPNPRHTTDKRWHGPCRQKRALRKPHTEDIIQLFVHASTPDHDLSAVKSYLFPRNSLQAEIRGPGYRLQTVVDTTHLVTRCQSIRDSVIRDLPYVTQIINCKRGISQSQALLTLRACGIDPADIDQLGIARSNKAITKRGDTVVVVWKRIWYPGESAIVLCPPITHHLLDSFRTTNLQKPRQYSHYLPLDDITSRQSDCDTISNYPRQVELGYEGNISGSIIFEYKEAPRGRRSPISNGSARPAAFTGYWLTVDHKSGRTNIFGRPQRQYLVLPDDPHRLPDSDKRVECRRYKVASLAMNYQADLSTVRASLDSTTAAQSYYQYQLQQLTQEVTKLREQLLTLTGDKTTDDATRINEVATPLNPVAPTFHPRSTPQSGTPPSSSDNKPTADTTKRQTQHKPPTSAASESPVPGTPAAHSATLSSPPALTRARNTTGGFAAAFKKAVSRKNTHNGPPLRAGPSTPSSAPTTEIRTPSCCTSAREKLEQILDLTEEREDPDLSEGDI